MPPRIRLYVGDSTDRCRRDLGSLSLPDEVCTKAANYLEVLDARRAVLSGRVKHVPEREVREACTALARSLGWEGSGPPNIPRAIPGWRRDPSGWDATKRNALSLEVAHEPATRWLAENDPDPKLTAYTQEMAEAAGAYGLSLDDG